MTDPHARRIEYLPVLGLKPNPRNPKAHSDATIADSVGRFGFMEPIVRDDRTGYIVSGHGRTKALRAMAARGEQPPDGVTVGPGGQWLVPVSVGWASRNDREAEAALVALNRTTELGGWDEEALLAILQDLTVEDDGADGDDLDALLGVGFSDGDILALAEKVSPSPPAPEPEGQGPRFGMAVTVEYECPACHHTWSGPRNGSE